MMAKPEWMYDKLPWRALVGPGVIRNEDGSLQASFRLCGPDLKSQPRAVQGSAMLRANNAIRRLGAGWMLHTEARRVPARDYPASTFPHPVAQRIDDERRAAFLTPNRYFYSEFFVTLSYQPPSRTASWFERLWVQGPSAVEASTEAAQIHEFRAQAHHLAGLLGGEEALAPLDDAETLTFLKATVSAKRQRVAVPDVPIYLNYQLCDSPFLGGFEPQLGPHHLRLISIVDFPDHSLAGILDGLNHLGFEYRWASRYLALPKPAARKIMRHTQAQWHSQRRSLLSVIIETFSGPSSVILDNDAVNKASSVDKARQEIGSDLTGYGYLTDVIVVWDTNPSQAEDKAHAVGELIDDQECVSEIEELNAVPAWLGSLPGDRVHNVRKPMVSSLNRVHLMPGLMSPWVGPERNEHLDGPPLFYASTEGSTPFRVGPHIDDVGNMLVCGPIGAGKTTMIDFCVPQWLRYPKARVVMYQMKGGGKCVTYCLGGTYIDLSTTTRLFQPLRDIDDPVEQSWAHEWVCDRLEEAKVSVTAFVRGFVHNALTHLAQKPAAHRTISGLIGTMKELSAEGERTARPSRQGDGTSGGMRDDIRQLRLQHLEACEALSFFCGGILDASTDFSLDVQVLCCEWERLLEDTPRAVGPILTHLWHRLDRGFTGDPVLFICDEFERLMTNDLIVKRTNRVLRTYRFRNVAMVIATQAVEDILDARIGSMLLQSCPTRILLPNPSAFDRTCRPAYEAMGLTETQIRTIAGATPKRQYLYASPLGQRLFDLRLEGTALAVCGRSRPQHLRDMDAVLADVGRDNFWREWLRRQGVDDAEADARADERPQSVVGALAGARTIWGAVGAGSGESRAEHVDRRAHA